MSLKQDKNLKSAIIDIENGATIDKKAQKSSSSPGTHIFGFDMNRLSIPMQLSVCIFAVFVLYLLYGYSQEWIFREKEFRKNGMFITLIQFGFYGVFGIIEQKSQENATRKIPLNAYFLLAILTTSTMGLSNTSLGYLNYPTQVMFKSSKLIPVMIGGIFIQGKSYTWLNFLSCALMTVGLMLFTYADRSISPNFDITGVILISLALCADAAIGNVQEKILKAYQASSAELVLYSYGLGFCILLVGNLLYGKLLELLYLLLKNPNVLVMLFLFSFTGYVGILFVLQIVRTFGALTAATVTTCRKAVTIILSFIFFAKPFSVHYIWTGGLVLIGIMMDIYSKNKTKIDQFFARASS